MPTPIRPQPQFSPYGRYLFNVDERKTEGATYFHDTQNAKVECGLELMPSNSISRFNNKAWAIQRGLTPCSECQP